MEPLRKPNCLVLPAPKYNAWAQDPEITNPGGLLYLAFYCSWTSQQNLALIEVLGVNSRKHLIKVSVDSMAHEISSGQFFFPQMRALKDDKTMSNQLLTQ